MNNSGVLVYGAHRLYAAKEFVRVAVMQAYSYRKIIGIDYSPDPEKDVVEEMTNYVARQLIPLPPNISTAAFEGFEAWACDESINLVQLRNLLVFRRTYPITNIVFVHDLPDLDTLLSVLQNVMKKMTSSVSQSWFRLDVLSPPSFSQVALSEIPVPPGGQIFHKVVGRADPKGEGREYLIKEVLPMLP